MKIRITIGGFPWTHRGPPHPEMEKRLLEIFAQYQPKKSEDISGTYGYPAYELSATADDPQFGKLLQDFSALLKKANPPAAAALHESPQGEEVKRARFLEPYYYGSDVDADNPGMLLCKECECPNLAHLPEPFMVNKDVLKKYDIFCTGMSLIIVRPRVLELLKNAAGDQIHFGESVLVKAKVKATGDDRLFWVRPKEIIGEKSRVVVGQKTCPGCKRVFSYGVGMTNAEVNKSGPGLFDDRYRVAHFGTGKVDIALVQVYENSWPHIVMSGALMSHLKANDVKGIVALTKILNAQCLFSQKGEPTLETEARTFAGTSNLEKTKEDSARLQQTRKETTDGATQKWFEQFLKRNTAKKIQSVDFAALEKKHKLTLPQDYKEFISTVGTKAFSDVNEMEGSTTTVLPPEKMDFKDYRRGKVPYLEGEDAEVDGVMFASMDSGDAFVFDVSVKGNDYPVFWHNHEENTLEAFAPNFAECIKRFAQRD